MRFWCFYLRMGSQGSHRIEIIHEGCHTALRHGTGCENGILIASSVCISVDGYRAHYPQIWQLRILNISSWRNVRKSRCRMDFLTFSWAGPQTVMAEVRSLPPEKSVSSPKDKGTQRGIGTHSLTEVPVLLHCAPLCPVKSLHDFPLSIKPSVKTLSFNDVLGSSFPGEGSPVT